MLETDMLNKLRQIREVLDAHKYTAVFEGDSDEEYPNDDVFEAIALVDSLIAEINRES